MHPENQRNCTLGATLRLQSWRLRLARQLQVLHSITSAAQLWCRSYSADFDKKTQEIETYGGTVLRTHAGDKNGLRAGDENPLAVIGARGLPGPFHKPIDSTFAESQGVLFGQSETHPGRSRATRRLQDKGRPDTAHWRKYTRRADLKFGPPMSRCKSSAKSTTHDVA